MGRHADESVLHVLHERIDDLGVITWCGCQGWGYAGPDPTRARELWQIHYQQRPGRHRAVEP